MAALIAGNRETLDSLDLPVLRQAARLLAMAQEAPMLVPGMERLDRTDDPGSIPWPTLSGRVPRSVVRYLQGRIERAQSQAADARERKRALDPGYRPPRPVMGPPRASAGMTGRIDVAWHGARCPECRGHVNPGGAGLDALCPHCGHRLPRETGPSDWDNVPAGSQHIGLLPDRLDDPRHAGGRHRRGIGSDGPGASLRERGRQGDPTVALRRGKLVEAPRRKRRRKRRK